MGKDFLKVLGICFDAWHDAATQLANEHFEQLKEAMPSLTKIDIEPFAIHHEHKGLKVITSIKYSPQRMLDENAEPKFTIRTSLRENLGH